MGITVADPCFESENDAATEFRAEGSVRFEHLLLRPETDPQTDCSADVSVAPRHSTVCMYVCRYDPRSPGRRKRVPRLTRPEPDNTTEAAAAALTWRPFRLRRFPLNRLKRKCEHNDV